MVSALAQIIGLVLLAVGGWMLWSAWSFVICGGLLLIGPEMAQFRRVR